MTCAVIFLLRVVYILSNDADDAADMIKGLVGISETHISLIKEAYTTLRHLEESK